MKYIVTVNDVFGEKAFDDVFVAKTKYDLGELIGSIATTSERPLCFEVVAKDDE